MSTNKTSRGVGTEKKNRRENVGIYVLTKRCVLSGAITVISCTKTMLSAAATAAARGTFFCGAVEPSLPANFTLNMFGTLVMSDSRRDNFRPIFFDCFLNRCASACCAALSREHESSMPRRRRHPFPAVAHTDERAKTAQKTHSRRGRTCTHTATKTAGRDATAAHGARCARRERSKRKTRGYAHT